MVSPEQALQIPEFQDDLDDDSGKKYLTVYLRMVGAAQDVWPRTCFKAVESRNGIGGGIIFATGINKEMPDVPSEEQIAKLRGVLHFPDTMQPRWYRLQ